jgi:uncharacterized protein
MRIGLISDTHSLMRPEALRALQGCDHIIHAGDIGSQAILDALGAIAPVSAIAGNNDTADWAASVPQTQTLTFGGVKLFVLHDIKQLKSQPAPAGVSVIICGHSHKPEVRKDPSGVLVVNPGSAGPRRFSLPITVAELVVSDGVESQAHIIELMR